ncbi:hypothetical protein B0A75_14800 [Flavobacterium oncorhynchi]|uniref:Uncharacterized protein n=1 Tax=Flavobacterium oncorhynchi TaxID=728056 RepID=A0A226HXU9_9FLAO|nr:DUF1737 domain-containing protein [Flavobacterium oncorhynchi]OXA98210.1 hypothetical protein B0A75_14800 [Flavobacterium oncorhynchi]
MNRKIIDYIVVEFVKVRHEETPHYSITHKGEELKVALNIKNLENEILILENNKIHRKEVIKYIEELLSKVEDFATYKVSEDDILFYRAKYNDSYPITKITYYDFLDENEDEYYRTELKKEVQIKEKEIAALDKKIAIIKNELQKLKIKESVIIENNRSLDFENFRTDFEKSVLYYLEKGYEPQGGVSISKNDSNYLVYGQAMVKYE